MLRLTVNYIPRLLRLSQLKFSRFATSAADANSGAQEQAQKIEAVLKELNIACKTCHHEPVFTCPTHEEAFMLVADEDVKDSTTLCKNLFLKPKKKKNMYLLVMKPDRELKIVTIGQYLGVKNLRFVEEEPMKATLGVGKGAVTPLAVMNDVENCVKVVIDEELTKKDYLGVHPLTNAATSSITPDQLQIFIKHFGNECTIVNFDAELAAEQPNKKGQEKQQKGKKQKKKNKNKKKHKKGETMLGIEVSKDEDFGKWYSEIVTKSELIEYYDISGCYILRPDAYFIWEQIQDYFNKNIRRMGIRNAYFPLFVSKSRLEAEADHIEGFAPEVAWVTRSGKSDLAEPIAIRPTSETIMYPAYAKWIKNHRNLPLKLNQWSNVVRWEFKNPTPFIRTREFLWQEGHSAFATKDEADEEVLDILDLYARVYEELLSIPVIKGRKTEMEKFPGGDYTTTVEAFIQQSGRGVQGATSHGLGQHFGKIFKIRYLDDKNQSKIPYQNSWGLTTRTIGVMVMQHSDNKGLVLPPLVAYVQAVIIPIPYKDTSNVELRSAYTHLSDILEEAGVRCHIDDRENHNPGWKFANWEVKGTPVRIEFGPKDLHAQQCILYRRDTGDKEPCKWVDLVDRVKTLLNDIQKNLLEKARERMNESTIVARTWGDFTNALDNKNMALSPSCNETKCEENIKEKTRADETKQDDEPEEEEEQQDGKETFVKLTGAAKSLCIPFDQPAMPEDAVCVGCGKKANCWILYGRSY